MDDNGESNLIVLIEITSSEWEMTPGVRVGMDIEQIRTIIESAGMHRIDEAETLIYADGNGYLTFQFAGGKVANITRDLNLC